MSVQAYDSGQIMITRDPPSPTSFCKLSNYILQMFDSHPITLAFQGSPDSRTDKVDVIIRLVKAGRLDPNWLHPNGGGSLLSMAMKLPDAKSRSRLICTLFQAGAIAGLEPNQEVPGYTCLTGTINSKLYSKSVVQLALSYGFDRTVFEQMVEQNKRNIGIPGKGFVKDESELDIDIAYSEVYKDIITALSLSKQQKFQDALDLFIQIETKLREFALREEDTIIQENYALRALHVSEKISELQSIVGPQTNETQQTKTHFKMQ